MRLSQKPEVKVPEKVISYIVKKYKQILTKCTNLVVRTGNGKFYQIKPEGNLSMNTDFTMVVDGTRPSGNLRSVLIWIEKNI